MSMEHEAYKAFATIPKEFKERGNDCMYQLQQAAKAFDEFAGQLTREAEQRREEEREEALLACKRQDDVIEAIGEKLARAQDAAQVANTEMRAAELGLRAARDSKPTRFPMKAEIAAWEQSVAMANEGLDKAQQKALRKGGLVDSLRVELQQAKEKMRGLEAKEFDLRPKDEQQELIQRGMDPLSQSFGLVGEARKGQVSW